MPLHEVSTVCHSQYAWYMQAAVLLQFKLFSVEDQRHAARHTKALYGM